MRLLIFIFIVIFIWLQYRLWFSEGSLPDVWRLESQINEQKLENTRLRLRNLALQAEVSDLQEGLEAVEERARSEMGMIKQGEVFYQIIEIPKNQGKAK